MFEQPRVSGPPFQEPRGLNQDPQFSAVMPDTAIKPSTGFSMFSSGRRASTTDVENKSISVRNIRDRRRSPAVQISSMIFILTETAGGNISDSGLPALTRLTGFGDLFTTQQISDPENILCAAGDTHLDEW